MSYALTDAGESDMRKELAVLDGLIDDIDQLSSQARDCDTVAPEVKTLLDMAWYFAEKAYREAHGCCSAGCGKSYCSVCAHFKELRNHAEALRGRL